MKKMFKFVIPAMVLAAGLILSTTNSSATPAIAKKENNSKCVVCHVKAGSKELNASGKCYKEKKDLKACAEKK